MKTRALTVVLCGGAVAWMAWAQTAEQSVRYVYDDAGRLCAAYYSRGSTNMATVFAYDLDGNRTRRTDYGVAPASGDLDGDRLDDIRELGFFRHLDQSGGGDPDADGLANSNEFAAAGNPMQSDTDRDGQDDLDEFIAGTGLDDGGHCFRIASAASVTGGMLRLSWDAVGGRTYRLEDCLDLRAGIWTNTTGEFVALSNAVRQVEYAVRTGSFLRVRVRLSE